ncbi:FitA-like ribbon-helix-helix domain-containing protein [Tsukamurella pseudospumae]|uniref:Antitoxin FitA-like ribbon-helix-helix domain-containing protein n=1 Tax=Tsukamurella pseudospumae TaxID=239498 RepID=A0A137ZI14_9ACTN|nr:hypothetical protein [Tsukamurella pseudospumae]KXO97810.1 hypothetical protein AXK61_21600 [Tsukamurella pseudospumae]
MTTITIRNVPEETRNELAARAARRGQSLQEYMLRLADETASRPDVDELVAEIRASKRHMRSTVTTESILADRDADRR